MYTPNTGYIIIEKTEEEKTTSGIILKSPVVSYVVKAGHDAWRGKQVYLNTTPVKLDDTHYAVDVKSVVAVK